MPRFVDLDGFPGAAERGKATVPHRFANAMAQSRLVGDASYPMRLVRENARFWSSKADRRPATSFGGALQCQNELQDMIQKTKSGR
jgi:hypothetical protein